MNDENRLAGSTDSEAVGIFLQALQEIRVE